MGNSASSIPHEPRSTEVRISNAALGGALRPFLVNHSWTFLRLSFEASRVLGYIPIEMYYEGVVFNRQNPYTVGEVWQFGNDDDIPIIVAVEPTLSVSKSGCFVHGTKINVGMNIYKNIEEIQVGNLIACWDFQNKCLTYQNVCKTFQSYSNNLIQITIDNPSKLYIRCTTNHPFWVTQKSHWCCFDVSQQPDNIDVVLPLEVGDLLLSDDNLLCEISSIEIIKKRGFCIQFGNSFSKLFCGY